MESVFSGLRVAGLAQSTNTPQAWKQKNSPHPGRARKYNLGGRFDLFLLFSIQGRREKASEQVAGRGRDSFLKDILREGGRASEEEKGGTGAVRM